MSKFINISLKIIVVLLALTIKGCLKTGEPTEAYDIIIETQSFSTNQTWDERTYIIDGTLNITEGAHLTIEPGCIIKLKSGSKIVVTGENASITAIGTEEKPITFTSESETPAPGDWENIKFYYTSSAQNKFSHCIFEYGGGYSDETGIIWSTESNLSFDNCTFSNSPGNAIYMDKDSYFNSFTGNITTEIGAYDIAIEGNYAHTIGTDNILNGNGIYVTGDHYEQSTGTWHTQTVPFIIDYFLLIYNEDGAELIIEKGNTIQFTSGGKIVVGEDKPGTLIANGTAEEPILFTSVNEEKEPGQWNFIEFNRNTTSNTLLNHCIIEAAGSQLDYVAAVDIFECQVSITNTELRTLKSYAITLSNNGSFAAFTGNIIHDFGEYGIKIYGNLAHTIGSNNTWDENGKGILVLGDDYYQDDATWVRQPTAYIIDGNLYIGQFNAPILRFEAGTVVKFTNNSTITVGESNPGAIIAQGTEQNPIIFTADDTENTPQPGNWRGIIFKNKTQDTTILDYCHISYGGGHSQLTEMGNLNFENITDSIPTISNCVISYSNGYGIYLNYSDPTLINNTFTGNILGDIGFHEPK